MSNPNKVREDFWRGSEKTDIDRLKQELIHRKVDLQTKQWMERKEHQEVKKSINDRYDTLKFSFDLKYFLKADDNAVSSERPHITSPCFDKKPDCQTSASLKDRIQLNKLLTRDSIDGGLIGVGSPRLGAGKFTHRGPRTTRYMMDNLTSRNQKMPLLAS